VTLNYPKPHTVDTVDTYFGNAVPDPYRWMEDPAAPEVRAFIDAQNAITHDFLNNIPEREAIRARLQTLFAEDHVPDYGEASRYGDSYFYSLNDGKDQARIFRRIGPHGTPEVVLDPNTWSDDGSIIMMNAQPSHDGKLLAYSFSRGGSDWQEYHVRDLTTLQDYEDELLWCKFTQVIWNNEGSGFYYNRFPAPAPGQKMLAENKHCAIYYHRIGTAQAEDVLIFEDQESPEDLFWPTGSDDGRWLVVQVRKSAVGPTGYYIWEIGSDAPFQRLLNDFDAEYDFGGSLDDELFFLTKRDAPKKQVIAYNTATDSWRDVVPESDDTLDAARVAGGKLVLFYMRNAHTVIEVYTPQGQHERTVQLPTLGSVHTYFLEANAYQPDFLFTFTSYLYPTTILRYDVTTDQLEIFQGSGIAVDTDNFITEQVFYPSSDGASVSMFITRRKDIALDGSHPTMVYAYGGFDAAVTPTFEIPYIVWLERGGILAVANLRGGGEYGEAWHVDGMREKKQHVFDDMINAGQWLIDNGYTQSSKLAIRGASNGGLLVAACVTQRPDLFGAGLCLVPVIDMLRYHRFTSGRLWTSEYGCADTSAEEFGYLHAYSPLHNVRQGETYPALIIATSDGDDRVVPMHSLKFAATLQAADSGKNPLLLCYGTDAGHGTLTVNKVIEEESDYLAFLSAALR
jgi:prolyl oligopeptidase